MKDQRRESKAFDLPRANVLLLDGGGVRGISALYILDALMRDISTCAQELGYDGGELRPHEIFALVAGTSTGGLISIMLGKLGMTAQECIDEYRHFARRIFGHKKWLGRLTGGLATARFSERVISECVRDLLQRRGQRHDLKISGDPIRDPTACAVVCRENEDDSERADLKRDAALICSLRCSQGHIQCCVHEAARATSAAPTYFKPQMIRVDGQNRYFTDGGIMYNNPSFITYHHYYTQSIVEKDESAIVQSQQTQSDPLFHSDLDLSKVRFINIGTGSRDPEIPERRRDRVANMLTPSMFLNIGHFRHLLERCATDAENTAQIMRVIATVAKEKMQYRRWSATTGVHLFKMDAFKDLDKIERLTKEYLRKEEVQEELRSIAKEIAKEYMQTENMPPQEPQIS